MGVDMKVTLPPFVGVRYVADVLGILAGNQADIIRYASGHESVTVEGVTFEGNPTDPRLTRILIADGDGVKFSPLYHFEWTPNGERGFMVPARPEWLAIGKGLVDFFGGSVDFNDCDATDVDYQVPPQTELANLDNDDVFDLMQQRLRNLQPLTQAEVDVMRPHAAYKQIVRFPATTTTIKGG